MAFTPLFPDPRRPTAVADPGYPLRPFLTEIHFEKQWLMNDQNARLGYEFSIQQIGAMCDEEVEQTDILFRTPHGPGPEVRLDRRYLMRIWPGLWKLPTAMTFSRHDDLHVYFPGKAVVVFAGICK